MTTALKHDEKQLEAFSTMHRAGVARTDMCEHFGISLDYFGILARRLGLPHRNKSNMRATLKIQARRAAKQRRPCITCHEPFLSDGPHHRMCTRCRNNTTSEMSHSLNGVRLR